METKIFLKPHELNTLREIRRASSDKNILNAQKLQKTAIVYHLQRIKVSIAQRLKVNHLQRVKVNH